MSEFVTVARPYAKAAFDFAVEHQNVDRWQNMLAFAAEVTKNEQMAELLSGALAPETLAASFIAVCGEQLDANGQNLIKVMAENGRLRVLPDVLEQFEHLRALSEATAEVEVTSATELSDDCWRASRWFAMFSIQENLPSARLRSERSWPKCTR